MAQLHRRFPDLDRLHVVDLGGFSAFWMQVDPHPRRVTVVNLDEDHPAAPWIESVQADACTFHAPDVDLVVSNSLIEHVGGHARRAELAETVRRLAPRYWVQTPYRYFPIEPHWLFPGFQFLPLWAQTEIGLRWRRGHIRPTTREESRREAMWVELLSVSEMQSLFPDGQIWHERFSGLTKSIVAVRG
jgi:hypothetical protein